MRGVCFGPTLSQLFRPSSQLPVDGAQAEKAQRMLFELQAEVTAEKLRRKVVEDKVTAKKLKRNAVDDEVAAEKLKRKGVEDDVAAEK
ncbi:hypothetical protein AHAS_Ahas14G0103600 [Arachis hypogaea]